MGHWRQLDPKDSESGMTLKRSDEDHYSFFGRSVLVNFDWISLKMEEWSRPEACQKMKLLPVWAIIGNLTKKKCCISGLMFCNQHEVRHNLYYYFRLGHMTEFYFQMRYSDWISLRMKECTPHETFCWKITLFPVWVMIGKFAEIAIS